MSLFGVGIITFSKSKEQGKPELVSAYIKTILAMLLLCFYQLRSVKNCVKNIVKTRKDYSDLENRLFVLLVLICPGAFLCINPIGNCFLIYYFGGLIFKGFSFKPLIALAFNTSAAASFYINFTTKYGRVKMIDFLGGPFSLYLFNSDVIIAILQDDFKI